MQLQIVESLVFCKLLYTVQYIEFEIFAHIYTKCHSFCTGELCCVKNDDYKVLKLKDFQGPLISNYKTFKPYSVFNPSGNGLSPLLGIYRSMYRSTFQFLEIDTFFNYQKPAHYRVKQLT